LLKLRSRLWKPSGTMRKVRWRWACRDARSGSGMEYEYNETAF
jgi:hypothetical protein